jgi:hypothetical protein
MSNDGLNVVMNGGGEGLGLVVAGWRGVREGGEGNSVLGLALGRRGMLKEEEREEDMFMGRW